MSNLIFWEHAPIQHPLVRPFKGLLRIWLKDQPFSYTGRSRIINIVVFCWQLIEQVVLILLLGNIDFALRALQCIEICPELFISGIAIDQKSDHKARIHYLTETLLL